MYCGKCDNHISRCVCPDLNDRIAALNKPGTHVYIETCPVCKEHHARCRCLDVGKQAMLQEDGLADRVEILSKTISRDRKEFDLQLVAHLNHSPEKCALEVGEKFHVMQRTDMGAWGGMWQLHPMPQEATDAVPQS